MKQLTKKQMHCYETQIRDFADLDRKLIQLNRRRLTSLMYQNRPVLQGGASTGSEAGILQGEFNRKPGRKFDWPAILLLAGLVGESVLLFYQLVVAKVICSYCIIVFAIVVMLNILHGRRQIAYGLAILAASLLPFSTLSFTSPNASSESFSLDQGVYGVKTCTHPSKQLFLIFSFDCPRCINVLEALENCSSCDLYLNPVDQVAAPPLVGIDQRESYNPEINRAILSLFGIDKVPVLLAKKLNGYTFISGADQIINYVQQACYTEDPLMYLESSMPEKNKIDLFTESDDE